MSEFNEVSDSYAHTNFPKQKTTKNFRIWVQLSQYHNQKFVDFCKANRLRQTECIRYALDFYMSNMKKIQKQNEYYDKKFSQNV